MKLAGALLMVCGGGFIGIYISRRYYARERQLQKCIRLLERISANLEFERLTTRELLLRAAEGGSLDELAFLLRAVKLLEQEPDFPRVWREALQKSRGELALTREDYACLEQLSELLGAYDAPTQQKGLQSLCSLLALQLEQAREQSRTNGRLARSLGLLCGVALAVMTI